jgi:hypothetical protein
MAIREKYYWEGLWRHCAYWTATCLSCALSKTKRQAVGHLLPLYVQQPFDRVSVDVIGPLPLSGVYTAVLVMVDASSGWVELAPLVSTNVIYVAWAFFSEWVCRYGLPKAFLSD